MVILVFSKKAAPQCHCPTVVIFKYLLNLNDTNSECTPVAIFDPTKDNHIFTQKELAFKDFAKMYFYLFLIIIAALLIFLFPLSFWVLNLNFKFISGNYATYGFTMFMFCHMMTIGRWAGKQLGKIFPIAPVVFLRSNVDDYKPIQKGIFEFEPILSWDSAPGLQRTAMEIEEAIFLPLRGFGQFKCLNITPSDIKKIDKNILDEKKQKERQGFF